MKPKPPCLDCKDRYVGCHVKCEKYIEFRKSLDDHNRIVKEYNRDEARDFLIEQILNRRK
jgi:hypothetical protein